ncbi:GTPase-activating protein GYP2 [Nakaseomyces bracarensis]|uniref:GTPase-activating protein GYP2 n=1 Tax=Nakaseomyces bracarensis TaxID=273131 RepID=A0ABR4NWR0_9SACH
MTYFSTFRDTLFVDVLEWLNLVKNEEELLVELELKSSSSNGSAVEAVYEENITKGNSDAGSDMEKSLTETVSNSTSSIESGESDPYLVTFTGEDDPLIPYNWSYSKRGAVIVQVMLLTCVNYMGSSIYTPGQEEIQKEFHVGHVVGTLNLSVYVLGYGIGPIFFSPLSEISTIGRLPTYMITFFLFTMLQIGCALVENIAGLVILRFITGILCSPALATGGASVGDIIPAEHVPKFLGIWSIGAVAAPVFAPLLGASMVDAKDWRWIFWLLFFLSAATYITLIFFFPETSSDTILHRKALRLRKLTGDNRYYTKKQREEEAIPAKTFLINTLYRPFKMMVTEPIILAFDLYISLCYGAFYLFFEAFPIVFVGIYNFTLIEVGLAYLGFCIGCLLAYALLMVYHVKVVKKEFANNTFTPESFLVLAMCVGWCLPLALFLFGWTASVHWILPMISEVFFVLATFNLFQATFSYLAVCYPDYVASVFAGNGFARASFAAAFPLFGKAMYDKLATKNYPVAWGSSLIGFITIGLWMIPFALYKYGPYLRSKSRFKSA